MSASVKCDRCGKYEDNPNLVLRVKVTWGAQVGMEREFCRECGAGLAEFMSRYQRRFNLAACIDDSGHELRTDLIKGE